MNPAGQIYRHAAEVSRETGVSVLDMYGAGKTARVVSARWLAWRRAAGVGHSVAAIAREFGRDRSSVRYALDAAGPHGAPLLVGGARAGDGCPRVLLIGHGDHGKDAAAEILTRRYGGGAVSVSALALDLFLWDMLSDVYPTRAAAYADRKNNRELWFHAIAAFNRRPGCAPILERAAAQFCFVTGARNRAEFQAARPLFDLVMWIDGATRGAPEALASMELGPADADLIVPNHGDLSDLERAAVAALIGKGWPPLSR